MNEFGIKRKGEKICAKNGRKILAGRQATSSYLLKL